MITNASNVPLALSVWAVNDSYDAIDDPKYFSATTLLKPVRQIILLRRIDRTKIQEDVEDYLARAMGTSIHDSIEKAWTGNYRRNLEKLGLPKEAIDSIRVNPDPSTVKEGEIPVYLEQRTIKEFNGYKIGGKFDFVADGLLHDNKSTTTMKWIKGSSDQDYQMQGSIYRWLNQGIIKDDFIRINFVFTDWSKLAAMKDPDYPQHRACYRDIPLLSVQDTEHWIERKLNQLGRYMDAEEKDIPECPEEELWMTPTKYKYFANPESARATKNFDSLAEAQRFKLSKGKGVIRIVPGEPRRCSYCVASGICSQFKRYAEARNGS